MLYKYIICLLLILTPLFLFGQINNTDKGAATIYTKGLPTGAVRLKYDSEWAIDINTSKIYRYDRNNSVWLLAGSMIGFQNNSNPPSGAPKYGAPDFILNNTGGLYGYYSSAWHCLNCATIGYTEGTGIDITGNVITNILPDQTVTLGNGTGISVTGTYPNFTITNTAPDQTVTLTGAGITNISGTYPNFTITSTEVDGSTTNEIQQIDTFTLSGDTLKLSLSSDGVPYKQVILTGLSSLSGGIYGPSDTVTYHHTAVIDSGLTFRSYEDTSYFNILTGLNYGSFLTLKPDSTLIRWFDVGGNNQILLNSDGINLSTTNPDRLTITGNDTRYTSDYRATYNDRSITDKKYQDDFYLQEVDTFRISNDTLFISLIRDSVPESFVVLSGLGGSSTDTSGYNLNFRISNDTLYIRDGNGELFVTIPLPNVYNLDIITPLPSVDVEGSIVLKTVDVNGSKILYVSNGTDWVEGGLFLDTLNVATINMGNDQVTYAKIQEVTAERLLGNPTGSTANPSEISLGSGLGFSGSTILNTGDLSTTNEIQQLDTFEIVSNVLRASLGLDGVPFKSVDLSPYLDNTDSSGYNSAFTRSGDTLFITDGLSTKFVVLPSGIVDTDDQTLSLSNDTLYISQGNSVFLRQYLDNTDSQQLSIDSSIVEGVERFTISLDSSTSISFDIPQVTDTDNQRIDTFSITNGVVSLSLQDDALPASTIDITESVQDITGGMVESNTETGITVTYDDATGKLNFVTVDQSLTNELQFPDTFEIVSDVLRLSLFNDGLPYKSVDLEPYLDNTDAQNLGYTAATGALTISGGTGTTIPVMTASVRGLTPDGDGSGTDEFLREDATWGVPPGVTNLTITGSGPTYTIDSNTGTDVVISGSGITLSESPANTLIFTATDPSLSNEGILGVGAGSGTSATLLSNTSTSSAVTINAAGILAITESTSSNGGSITLTATEIDGSISNEGVLSVGAGTGTTSLIQSNSSGSATITLTGAGITTVNESGNTITITSTEVDGSVSNEIQQIDTFTIVSNILRVSLGSDGVPFKSVDLSPYLDNTDAQSLTITGASSPFTLDISGSASDINFASSTGIALTESPANTLVITNSAPDQTVSITGAGISNVTGTYPNFTITSTEIDGSTTNEIQTIDTFTIVSNILRLSLLNDGLPFNSVDLSSYLDNTDSQTLSIDSIDIGGIIERFEVSISNGNSVYIDVPQVSGSGAGQNNVGGNLGSGTGVYAGKTDTILQFKSLVEGYGIDLSNTSTEITIEVDTAQVATLHDVAVVQGDIDAHELADGDLDDTNELQSLTIDSVAITGKERFLLEISDGNTVAFDVDLNTDTQDISIDSAVTTGGQNFTVTLQDGGDVDFFIPTNTDNQTLILDSAIVGSVERFELEVSNGNSVFFDIPQITDTDNQSIDTFTYSSGIITLSLQDDGLPAKTIDISGVNTDNQTLDTFEIVSNVLRASLTDDGVPFKSVDLSPYLDNTDTQDLSIDSTTVGSIERFTINLVGSPSISFDVSNTTGTVTSVAATQPAAGITISGSPITGSGTLTFALANDLAGLEGQSGTGIVVRTGDGTYAQRTATVFSSVASTANLAIGNANGVSGNPLISIETDRATSKLFVQAVSTSNLDLNGTETIDGVSVTNGQRVLVAGQTAQKDNGIWDVVSAGAWTRSTDANTSAKIDPGILVHVKLGVTYGGTMWRLTTVGPYTVGTTDLVFEEVFKDENPTNELQTISVTGTTTATLDLSSDASDASITGAGINVVSVVGDAITITGTEIDGSISNEGSLTVAAGTGTTSIINSNTSGQTGVTITAAGINTISEVGNVITLTATEVDGSTSNELQTIANTSNSTTHTATLSNGGGSIQLVEGTGIGLATTGTALDGIVTITNSAPDQTVSITNGGGVAVSGTYPSFTLTATDQSITNEIQTLDTFEIVFNVLRASLTDDGVPFKSVDLSSYLDNTDSQTLSIDSTDLTGIERYAISISNGNTIYLDDDDRQTLSIDSTTVGTSERFTLSVSEGNNVSFDIPQGTVIGTGTAPQVALWNSTNGLTGSSTLTYQTNTMSFLPTTKDTILYVLGEGGNYFGVSTHVDTFNAAATAYKIGALNRNGRVYITSYETYLQGAFRQVEGSGIEFRGTTGSFFLHPNGDQYSGTTTGDNATHNRNLHWYFTSGGTFYGNPVVFQHNFSSNDSTGNSFEFLARNTASGGITIPDSTLFRVGNWDRGVALEIKHSRDVGLKTKSPRVALDINDTDAVILPSGTTAQRPGTPYAGAIRFNSDSTAMEYGNGSAWVTFGAGTGGGTNIYNSDGRIKDGGTVVDVGLNNALIFDLDSNALLDNRVIYMQVETDDDVTYTRWLSMVAPTDSFRISSFDQTIYMEFEGVTGAGEGLVISSNTILDLRADSTKLTGAPIRSEAHYLTGWYNNTLSKIEGTTNGQVLVWDETAGNWELGSGGGAIADADYGDITVSSSGTVWNIDAGVVGNTEIGSGAGGIYKGDGTLSSGTTNATLPASGILRFEYNGGNAGLIVDDANSTSSIFSKDGTQFLSADNTQVLVGSGTSKMEYIDGVLRVYDSDATQYIAIQTPATGSLTSNYTITLPADDGTLDQFLKTDGNGGLSWATIAGGGDILNGGNTTGAALTIGTNDANALNFEINNTTALTLGTTYGLTATAAIATTNTVTDRIAIHSTSTTTPSAGFGSAIVFQGESSTNDNRDMARIFTAWTNATDASREAKISFSLGDNGSALSENFKFDRVGSTSGAFYVGVSSTPVMITQNSITSGTSYTFGGSAFSATLNSSLTSSATAVLLNASGNNTSASGTIGNTTFSTTSGTKYDWRFSSGYTVSSGTGGFYNVYVNPTINQTISSGATGFMNINPTLTNISGGYDVFSCPTSNSAMKFINQSGSSTKNIFAGNTMFGSTSDPSSVAAVEISSTTKGFLLPRMTTTQRDAITAVAGLLIFNTTTTKMECYDGSTWQAAW